MTINPELYEEVKQYLQENLRTLVDPQDLVTICDALTVPVIRLLEQQWDQGSYATYRDIGRETTVDSNPWRGYGLIMHETEQ